MSTSTNAFIFHGTAGYPEENWFPWLKAELEKTGRKVFVPQFPTPAGQSVQAWNDVLAKYRSHINKDTIFVGHSLGGLFLLRLLEELPEPVNMAVFVGTPIGKKPLSNYERDSSFSNGFHFDWNAIKEKASHFSVFHSDNDPYVSLANGENLAKYLGVGLIFIPNAGHFNTASGYTSFEELRRSIADATSKTSRHSTSL